MQFPHMAARNAVTLALSEDAVNLRAVAETGLVSAEDIAAWIRFHMPDGRWRGVRWTVGHADLLAVAPGEC